MTNEENPVTAPTPFETAIGKSVHYVSYGTPGGEYKSECRAAVITKVNGPVDVDLCVLNPTGVFFNQNVEQTGTSQKVGGTWHYYTECQRQY